MSQTVWQRRDCVSAEIEDSLVLLDLESLTYHSLNPTAAAIWNILESPQPAPAIVDALCKQYRVTPEVCTPSVDRLLAELTTNNLVKPTE